MGAQCWGSLIKTEGLAGWSQYWEPGQQWGTELELKKVWMDYGLTEEAKEEPDAWVWLLR